MVSTLGLTGARDALELVAEFSRLEHLASAGVALAARRVAQTDLWKQGGHRSAAHWLDHVTGMGLGDAVRLLQAAETVEAAPDTFEALKAGRVSTREAKAIGAAEAADPGAGQRLLAAAESRSTKETENDAARVVAAASKESPAEKAERHRKARRVHHGVNADGMGYGSWLLPIAEHTRIVAQLDGERSKVFDQARIAGVRESADAYTADAFCRVFDRAGAKAPNAAGTGASADAATGGTGEVVEDWSFTKMIVRVDLTALDRGDVAAGEVCEIAGQGPIPVADAWRMIDGDAFVAAVTTNGTEIDKVIHLGRKPTVLQKTALEWFSAGECSIDGCTNPAPHRDRPRQRLGRHEDHHPPRPRLTLRAPPRPQDPPRLPVRAEAPQRETQAHPTRREPTRQHRPTRPHPADRRGHRPAATVTRHRPGRPLRHRLTHRDVSPTGTLARARSASLQSRSTACRR